MRKTAEACDQVVVQLGVLHVLVIANGTEQVQRALLVIQRLRVFVRHVEEDLQRGIHLRVEARLNGPFGVVPRQPVGGIGMRTLPEAVAWKLVQQQHQRQRARGIAHPAFQLPPRRAEVQPAEALVELGVERIVVGEPLFVAGVLPEADDVVAVVHVLLLWRLRSTHLNIPVRCARSCRSAPRARCFASRISTTASRPSGAPTGRDALRLTHRTANAAPTSRCAGSASAPRCPR